MNVDKLTLKKIFDTTERLEAPLFQRPYVWTKEDNWQPLWEAIQTVAERRIVQASIRPHFLGTIVLDQIRVPTGKISARQIIDGQQRLTTLQLALAAARDLSRLYGQEQYGRAFAKLTDNDVPLSDCVDEIFKVWPTNADREDFRQVMKSTCPAKVRKLPHSDPNDAWLIPDAYLFFSDCFMEWLGNPQSKGFAARLDALHTTLRDDLQVVVIDLEEKDDAQEIFETLNALGTPLLPADLVKNFLFHLADGQQHDIQKLYNQYWVTFDVERSYWRGEKRMGRLKRPRIDVFLYYYVTLMKAEDILVPQVFRAFREFVGQSDGMNAAMHMEQFNSYAGVYRGFDQAAPNSREELFFYRLDQMDTTTVFPLLLEIFKQNNTPELKSDLLQILVDLESFFIRRAVCELTPKNYNRFVVDLIKEARAGNDFSASNIRTLLLKQTAEISRWPDDKEFKEAWLALPFYKRLKRARTRMILEALERELYTEKTEKIDVERSLTVEHLLPQKWAKQWPLTFSKDTPGDEDRAERLRKDSLHKIGNLTLLTKALNPAVSNGPWLKKRQAILQHSALNLNRPFQNIEAWDESAIDQRTEQLFSLATKIWPHP
ncbi:MAG: DUF262 domain-containing HNH endonuclease family protein [Verrucomicrobia bacterium]|nr:DUF262 domain-containing HNH endonuclease family protein [Verrucomicrobiota bacterium]